jgi:hypothetical protein
VKRLNTAKATAAGGRDDGRARCAGGDLETIVRGLAQADAEELVRRGAGPPGRRALPVLERDAGNVAVEQRVRSGVA